METIILNAKTRQEIANEYGISIKTLNRWIKKAKLDIPSGLIDPLHLNIIYETFGVPGILKFV
jgi:transposase-like protein